ncbi:MAG: pyrimidine reductase, partial [Gammaproteobacteria bacterium]
MTDDLLRLFPIPTQAVSLQGCYLAHGLHRCGQAGRPFVYTNFITSLDGRIAIAAPGRNTHQVPPAIANPRDWRLYQELGAQADVLITTARYLRQLAIGEAQDMLPVGLSPDFEDLRRWRLTQGLPPQPDVAVLSASLDFPAETLTGLGHRRIYVITGESADPERIRGLRDQGIDVR